MNQPAVRLPNLRLGLRLRVAVRRTRRWLRAWSWRLGKRNAWIARRDPLRRLPYELVAQACWLGLLLAATDAVAGTTSSDLAVFEVDPARLTKYFDALLVFSGGPIVLLVALASLAVPSLSPAISSSLPLLYRRYPRYRWRFQWALHVAAAALLVYWLTPLRGPDVQAIGWSAAIVVGLPILSAGVVIATLRTNPLYRALLVAGALTIGLSAMRITVDLGLPSEHLATATVATALALVEATLLVVLVVWLLRLRQSSELVQGLVAMATNLIEYVERTEPGELLPTQRSTVRDELVCATEEQEELKQLIAGLQQIGLRSLHDDQPVPAEMVVRGVGVVQAAARVLDGRRNDWLRMRDPGQQQVNVATPWVEVLCINTLATLILAAAEEHYFTVGSLAGGEIGRAALLHLRASGTVLSATDFRQEVLEEALQAYANAYDECIQFGEVNLSDELLAQFAQLLNELRGTDDFGWLEFLTAQIADLLVDAGRLAVARDEVAGVRGLLSIVRAFRAEPGVRDAVLGAVIDLGAVALASRAYRVASVLLEWLERLNSEGDFVGPVAVEFVRTQTLNRTAGRPLEATDTYMRVFLMLAVARGVSLRHRWDPAAVASIFDLASGMPEMAERLRITCARLAAATDLPEAETVAWQATLENWQGRART